MNRDQKMFKQNQRYRQKALGCELAQRRYLGFRASSVLQNKYFVNTRRSETVIILITKLKIIIIVSSIKTNYVFDPFDFI